MKYTSQAKQLTIGEFRSSLEGLDKSNRWVMLGDLMPWAKIEKFSIPGCIIRTVVQATSRHA